MPSVMAPKFIFDGSDDMTRIISPDINASLAVESWNVRPEAQVFLSGSSSDGENYNGGMHWTKREDMKIGFYDNASLVLGSDPTNNNFFLILVEENDPRAITFDFPSNEPPADEFREAQVCKLHEHT